ncbi:MAG: hypothetical protein JSR79_01530 [Proteobacteria bacterium]|nr:hypothetical protein [Pseudomonadota bacterium]
MIKFRAVVTTLIAIGAALPTSAQTYGDTLAAKIAAMQPGIVAVTIDAAGKDGKPIHVAWGNRGETSSSAPLADATGEPIGSITVSSSRRIDVARIARRAARRIYIADNLAEPDPFVPGAVRSARAQTLVDAAIDTNPDLVTLAMHVALPGADNTIIASNFGRIGKSADKDDAEIIAKGVTRRETTNNGRRLAVELPLLDASGRVIGALSTSFAMAGLANEARVTARAVAVRDALARRIPSLEALANK